VYALDVRRPVATLFVALILGGLGVPLPEEVSLVSAGVLAKRGFASPVALGTICLVGLLLSDLMLYATGRALGVVVRRLLVRSRRRRAPYHPGATRWGARLVVARVVPGLRTIGFLAAGATHVPLRRFVLFDLVGALACTALWAPLGWHYAERIDELWRRLGRSLPGWATVAGITIVALLLARRAHKVVRAARQDRTVASRARDDAAEGFT
jgi:membrane protein DedA with SNARE-associated domain